ncbi:RluA family pseudouridine synthase [Gorillibacterium massiliense]|uniref:RluA family pseudouridine synthase n=1 Tax=Gorillibacterium massiliense TaxID=1280390 RepID=UPI0004AC6C60|nr:RluA family pseudouridine synthase [Gorillibacterium massiliense]
MRAGIRKDEWLELAAEADGQDLNVWLREASGLPDKLIRKLEAEKGVRIKGDRLFLRLFPREEPQFAAEWNVPPILYEDDFCLVADKPAGMAVHPSRPEENGTLANAIAGYYIMTGQECRVRHIHRLDEDTSGPVLYAKNELAQLRLDEEMRKKTIGRTYLAVVHGRLGTARGTIDAPIGKDRHQAGRRRVSATGDPAVTHYETVEDFPGFTLVRLRLETGRTHQIRVHMSHIGHPLAGDELYGGKRQLALFSSMPESGSKAGRPAVTYTFNRQALHGERLSFPHPMTGEWIQAECPLPEDFHELLQHLRKMYR